MAKFVHGKYSEFGMEVYIGDECVVSYLSDEPEDVEANRELCLQESLKVCEEEGLMRAGQHYDASLGFKG